MLVDLQARSFLFCNQWYMSAAVAVYMKLSQSFLIDNFSKLNRNLLSRFMNHYFTSI